MRIRVSVVVGDPRVPQAASPVDVLLDAPTGSTFGHVREPLLRAAGVPTPEQTLRCLAHGLPIPDSAVVGEPPLLRGVLITVLSGYAAWPDPQMREPPALLELHIVGGPEAGRIIPVGRGTHVIGRAADCTIRLADAGVSRRHTRLEISPDGVTAQDLEPTNPSTHRGTALGNRATRMEGEQHVTLASTSIVVRRSEHSSAQTTAGEGVIRVHRPPRFLTTRAPAHITFPQAPTKPEGHRLPLIAALAPLILSGALAWAMGSAAMLLFGLLSPVMLLGQWLSDRRHGRVSHRKAMARHRQQVDVLTRELAATLRREADERRLAHPDLGLVSRVAATPEPRLWERRPDDPDYLVLRVGTAVQFAQTVVEGREPSETPSVADVPALVGLAHVGVLGVTGSRERLLSLASGLILQLATWHSPRDVRLLVLTTAPDAMTDWGWASRLPHAQPLRADGCLASVVSASEDADLSRLLQELRGRAPDRDATSGAPSRGLPSVVVVLDGSRELRRRADVAELLRRGTEHGVVWLCLDGSADSLPAETRAHLALEPGSRPRATLQAGDTVVGDIIPDLPTRGWAERLGRSLAPLEEATPDVSEASLPATVSFRNLHVSSHLGLDPADPISLARHWATAARPRTALLGRSGTDAYAVDLVADGPHVLVGGTTGAGKSELLRSFIAALAVAHRPDELTFVLVDYKGGSAFQECASLPHTVGLVTDLDEHLGARALTSLGAELKRRERLLATHGAKDLAEYHGGAGRPKLPRLVLVVDEFKMLADELPDFVDGLVRLAAVGRSLGVHLVLATQRPGGAVSGDMRANIALRIALRVRDRADSIDVVEAPDAAAISDRHAGRAWIRTAGLELTEVQTAYVGGPLDACQTEADVEPTARPVAWRDLAAEPSSGHPSPSSIEGPTELAGVVEAAGRAAELLGVEKIPSPWLPELPELLDRSGLDAGALPGDLIPLGLVDRPAQQRQDTLAWDLDQGGHLGIAGGPRTGRTTSLLTLAVGIAERQSPADVQVHALEGAPGSLRGLCALPHVGTVAGGDDLQRARRLVARLLRELAERQATDRSRPVLVVLVDGWESLEDGFDAIDHGAPADDLLRLLRDGLTAGIRFAMTGGRALTTGRLSSLLQQRLLLGMPDPLDLALAGVSPSDLPAYQGPGRAIDPRDGCEVQLACPGTSRAEQEHAVARVAIKANELYADLPQAARPWRIEPLPQRVALDQIPPASPSLLTIGVGGDGLEPLGFDPPLGQRHVLIAGPGRSGRSTALFALASQLIEREAELAVVTTRPSPLTALNGMRGVTLVGPEEADAFVTLRREVPDLAVLVDDADNLEGSPIEHALVETSRLVDSSGGFIAAAADLHRATSAYRGLLPDLARHGTGLILNPRSPADGEVFRMRVDALVERHPGRGLLVADCVATPVQIATDPPLVGL